MVTSEKHRSAFLAAALLLMTACFNEDMKSPKISLQSSHAGTVKKIVLVYTWTAEMGLISLIDILKALSNTEAVVISQFSPKSDEFRVFFKALTRDGLGFDKGGKPRLHFVQDFRSYGPWPRDQALVDDSGNMWVSASDQHKLKAVFSALNETYGIQRHETGIQFAGANLLACGGRILYPDRLDTSALNCFLKGPFISLPSPKSREPFHLDLLVMPLSDSVVAVGDDSMARAVLMKLSKVEQERILARWTAEYAASAQNLELRRKGNHLFIRQNSRPALISWPMLSEKLAILAKLSQPGQFQNSVVSEPEYEWDDQIASVLKDEGFNVVRVPFWPATVGSVQGRKIGGLPMICYPNSLVWEDGILMPVYSIPALDSLARGTLEQASGKRVYAVRGGAILGYGSSGPHCLTIEFRD